MTQEELADEIGVRQSDISALERGHVQLPRRPRLQAIASALGITLGELLAASGWLDSGSAPVDRLDDRLWGPPESPREVFERIFPEMTPAEIDDVMRYARFLLERREEYDPGAG